MKAVTRASRACDDAGKGIAMTATSNTNELNQGQDEWARFYERSMGAELSRRALQEHEALDHLLSGLLVVFPDDRFAPAYARLLAATTHGGPRMAAMDLMIATAAILDATPLVTRNVKDFSRVPGLQVLDY